MSGGREAQTPIAARFIKQCASRYDPEMLGAEHPDDLKESPKEKRSGKPTKAE